MAAVPGNGTPTPGQNTTESWYQLLLDRAAPVCYRNRAVMRRKVGPVCALLLQPSPSSSPGAAAAALPCAAHVKPRHTCSRRRLPQPRSKMRRSNSILNNLSSAFASASLDGPGYRVLELPPSSSGAASHMCEAAVSTHQKAVLVRIAQLAWQHTQCPTQAGTLCRLRILENGRLST
jgi:hypothetical protein